MKTMCAFFKIYLQAYADATKSALALNFLLPFCLTLISVSFWQSIPAEKFPIYGMSREQLVTYMLLTFIFREMFNVVTPVTELLWNGSIVQYYARPVALLQQFILVTISKYWLFKGLIFSLPTLLLGMARGWVLYPTRWLDIFYALYLYAGIEPRTKSASGYCYDAAP